MLFPNFIKFLQEDGLVLIFQALEPSISTILLILTLYEQNHIVKLASSNTKLIPIFIILSVVTAYNYLPKQTVTCVYKLPIGCSIKLVYYVCRIKSYERHKIIAKLKEPWILIRESNTGINNEKLLTLSQQTRVQHEIFQSKTLRNRHKMAFYTLYIYKSSTN